MNFEIKLSRNECKINFMMGKKPFWYTFVIWAIAKHCKNDIIADVWMDVQQTEKKQWYVPINFWFYNDPKKALKYLTAKQHHKLWSCHPRLLRHCNNSTLSSHFISFSNLPLCLIKRQPFLKHIKNLSARLVIYWPSHYCHIIMFAVFYNHQQ